MDDRERIKQKKRKSIGTRGKSSDSWLAIVLLAICLTTLIFVLVQMKSMVSGELGGSPETMQANLQNDTESEAEDENNSSILNGLPLICVDAGHGFDDPGAMNSNLNGLDEKDITLDIALRLAKILEEMGYPVVMTRASDEILEGMELDERGLYVLDPYDRCEIANEAEVDLFISIHCNSLPSDTTKSGMQLYYTEGHTKNNAGYAQDLADALLQAFGEMPQVLANPENDSYVVDRLVNAPSVLVETGFITNAGDARRMLSEDWRQQMAQALAEGISEFLTDDKNF